VFKIITAAALVDAGVPGDTRVCYHGGQSRLGESDLVDSERDRLCATLSGAVGGSINAIFAKLATRHLDQATLERYAGAFGFGHALPFDVPTAPSPGRIPDDRTDTLEFARTSAGFWHMHMSPLHGALIAATFANDGQMMRASIVDRVVDRAGQTVLRREPEVFRNVVSRRTARAVGEMMEETVTRGTARRSFFDDEGLPFLPGIRVAGKTGTLSGTNPYRGYTWWVGYAPADRPTIAVAALVVNTPTWRIKASYVARETLRQYLMR
jgi:cell division protein FtsI/penicillin-binding protein 2